MLELINQKSAPDIKNVRVATHNLSSPSTRHLIRGFDRLLSLKAKVITDHDLTSQKKYQHR